MTDTVIQLKDPSLATLIRLELERNGVSVIQKSDNCLLFITDTNERPNFKYSFKIGVVRSSESLDDSFDVILRRPIDLSELRQTIFRLFEYQNTVKETNNNLIYTFPNDKTVIWEGRRTKLTNNEFIILSALLEANGEPVSRERLNEITDSAGNAVDVYICYLRKKLFFNGKNPIITVRGKGYACIVTN